MKDKKVVAIILVLISIIISAFTLAVYKNQKIEDKEKEIIVEKNEEKELKQESSKKEDKKVEKKNDKKEESKKKKVMVKSPNKLVKPLSKPEPVVDNRKHHNINMSVVPYFRYEYTESFYNQLLAEDYHLEYKKGNITEAVYSLGEIEDEIGDVDIYYQGVDNVEKPYFNVEPYKDRVSSSNLAIVTKHKDSYINYVYNLCNSLNRYTTDEDLINQVYNTIQSRFSYKITDASMYHFITSGTGQCYHYARLFNETCLALGLKSEYVQNETHAWNYVTVNGVRYKFDLTHYIAWGR